MNNYAGRSDVDENLISELADAGIEVFRHGDWYKSSGEVKTDVVGTLHGWSFSRAWVYWIATGPGLPPAYANALYKTHGQEVRVAGHCGCPPPSYYNGFGVGLYHVDSAKGLKALADALKLCAAEAEAKAKPVTA